MINVKDYLIKLEGESHYERFMEFVGKVFELSDDELREFCENHNIEYFIFRTNIRIFKHKTLEKRVLRLLKKAYYEYSELL